MTNLDTNLLPFFLVLYETLGLCGHPVIEKVQKINLYDILFAFFGDKKLVILASRLCFLNLSACLKQFINLRSKRTLSTLRALRATQN